jgi:hypothetical protein
MALQYCGQYCSDNKNEIDGDCHDLDYQAGNDIVLQPDGTKASRCYCVCSCLAVDTPIATPDGTIKVQDVKPRQTTVLAAGKDLTWAPTLVTQASFATPGVTEHTIYLKYQLAGENETRELVVTRDHPFILHDGTLIVADWLQVADQLTDRDGQPAQVVEVGWGSYDGNFYEFATVMEPPPADLAGHLVLTNGVVSGDFAVQVFCHIEKSAGRTSVAERPSVGSEEWVQAHNDESHPEAELRTAAVAGQSPELAEERAVGAGTFSPAALRQVEVPDHAAAFLPAAQARRLQKVGAKRPVSDTYYHQMIEFILSTMRPLYPEITFLCDWYSEEVNSHSWVDDGQQFVLVKGGLVRMEALEMEGLYLAVGHEVGHLTGAPDGSDSGVTCEGEADYFGSKIVLRKVWFGTYYLDNMEKAIDQVKALWAQLRTPHDEGAGPDEVQVDRSGNTYPPIPCRLDTFTAAMALAKKPECAACATAPLEPLQPPTGGGGEQTSSS